MPPELVSRELTLRPVDHISLRLYHDCRPHNLEIAALQKGLVLVLDDRELIEEGIGFGVPVICRANETFFSTSARISTCKERGCTVAVKSFVIDAVSRRRILNGPLLNNSLYSPLHRAFEGIYTRGKPLKPLFNRFMELRGLLGLRTQFVKVNPRGRIKVAYRCIDKAIHVEVDLGGLERAGRNQILILNEQGSSYFRRYFDSSGLELLNEQIEPWERVEADEASLSDVTGTLVFSLRNVRGAALYRGREQIKGRLAWAGLDYILRPEASLFSYTIRMRGRGHG